MVGTDRVTPLCLALLALVVACDRTPSSGAPSSSSSSPAPSASGLERAAPPSVKLAQPVAVSGEVAFELVAVDDGVALVAASPVGAVTVQRLDAGGATRGDAITVRASGNRVVEIAAAAVADRLGVAWVERDKDGSASAWASMGDLGVGSFAPPVRLGDSSVDNGAERGHLAATVDDGAVRIFRRGGVLPCRDHPGEQCTAFGAHELTPTGPVDRGLPLSVPATCGAGIAAYATPPGRWHYAVCSNKTGTPVTTLFNVERTPRYAEAKPVLEGCAPRGSLLLGARLVVAGRCKDGARAVVVDRVGAAVKSVNLSTVALSCDRGHPALTAEGEEKLEVVLREPQDGLAALLPVEMAPAGARAVWTGLSLLVARFSAGKAALRRYQCETGRVVEVR